MQVHSIAVIPLLFSPSSSVHKNKILFFVVCNELTTEDKIQICISVQSLQNKNWAEAIICLSSTTPFLLALAHFPVKHLPLQFGHYNMEACAVPFEVILTLWGLYYQKDIATVWLTIFVSIASHITIKAHLSINASVGNILLPC